MMEKLAQPGEGGGVHAHPLSLYTIRRTKLCYMLQLSGQVLYTPPISTLPLYVLYARPLTTPLLFNHPKLPVPLLCDFQPL
jgi:hypothetical protein